MKYKRRNQQLSEKERKNVRHMHHKPAKDGNPSIGIETIKMWKMTKKWKN